MARKVSLRRRGSVLIVVLVFLMLLTLGVYAFTERMLIERRAAAHHAQALQAQACADSGVEVVAAALVEVDARDELLNAPERFRGIAVNEIGDIARFSVVSPSVADESVRFGPANESAKLNLNTLLPQSELEQTFFATGLEFEQRDFDVELRDRLLPIPGMTPALADSILDWLDADDESRTFGAEFADYANISPPIPRNGPIETLEELLSIPGVTRELLDGEDANRNGLLDLNEDDGAASPPMDDADGQLEIGWSGYLTVLSRESPVRRDGRHKIHLNQNDLAGLFDTLEAEFGFEAARFVTAFRLVGPVADEASGEDPSEVPADERTQQASQSIQREDSKNDSMKRGGLSLISGGQYQIFSLYELIDSRVQVEVDGELAVLDSPWSSSALDDELPKLLDAFSIAATPFPGRININEARLEVLMTVPGLSARAAETIVESAAHAADNAIGSRSTTGWLVSESVVTLAEMRRLDRYLTAGGSVYRVQVVGFFDGAGSFCRVEATFDASKRPAKVIAFTDLSDLGRGFRKRVLLPSPDW